MAKKPSKKDALKTVTIKMEVFLPATPHEVYEAFMDSSRHSAFTQSEAIISRKIGGEFSAWGGSIRGFNKELKPDKKIVQHWYCETDGWPEGHYSLAVFALARARRDGVLGTIISFTQAGLPAAAEKDITQGWKDYYWKPLEQYFSK